MPPTSRSRVRRDIQGLRAVAVVLTHVLGWPRGGFAGVDVFFMVSGYTHLTVAYAERIAPVLRADLAAMGLL